MTFFLFCVMYCITYLFFLVFLLLFILWVLQGYSFLWGLLTGREIWVLAGLSFSPSVWMLLIAGLVPQQLVPCFFQTDRHSVSWPCLPCSWNPPALRLRLVLLLQCCHVCTLGSVQDVLDICLPPYLTDSVYNTPPVASGMALCSTGEYFFLLVCSPSCYHMVLSAHCSVMVNVGTLA